MPSQKKSNTPAAHAKGKNLSKAIGKKPVKALKGAVTGGGRKAKEAPNRDTSIKSLAKSFLKGFQKGGESTTASKKAASARPDAKKSTGGKIVKSSSATVKAKGKDAPVAAEQGGLRPLRRPGAPEAKTSAKAEAHKADGKKGAPAKAVPAKAVSGTSATQGKGAPAKAVSGKGAAVQTSGKGAKGSVVAVEPKPADFAKGKSVSAKGAAVKVSGKTGASQRSASGSTGGRTSRSGEVHCREIACESMGTTGGYCRLHYIKNWKKIKRKEVILRERKLNQYIEELVAKYPEKYIDAIRQDLANDKEFAKVIYDLDLDESVDDFEGDSEGVEGVLDGIKRDFEDEGEGF